MTYRTAEERWRPVPGTENRYRMSTWDRVQRRVKNSEEWVFIPTHRGKISIHLNGRQTTCTLRRLAQLTYPEALNWRPAVGFGGRYDVSDGGCVREGEKILDQYRGLVLLDDGTFTKRYAVRDLVAEAFGWDVAMRMYP